MITNDKFVLRHADFSLEGERQALRDSFNSFLQRECPVERVRAAEPVGFDVGLWEQFLDMRAHAMGVPVACGGDGAGLVELVLVAEAIGRFLAPAPVIEAAVSARLLGRASASNTEWLDAALEGTKLITLALQPLDRDRPQLVPAGCVADAIIGLLDGELVVASMPTPLDYVPNHGLAPVGWFDLRSADVRVDTIAVGPEAEATFEVAVQEWKLLTAAAQVGVASGALPLAVDFASNRLAFGVPIATFQAISHPLADCYTGILGARRLVWKAAWYSDHEPAVCPQLVPMAFRYAASVATQTVTTAVHTQGGLGFTLESDVQLYFRRAKGWANLLGDPQSERLAIADELYGPPGSI
jgi:alkylation response protein AidB-like acyl-CoA dehydrogenase